MIITFRRGFMALIGCSLAGALALGWIGSSAFISPPRRALEPRHQATLRDPAAHGFSLESFDVKSPDGFVLKAALLSSTSTPGIAEKTRQMRQRLADAGHPPPTWGESRATVVMAHGRRGIKEDAFPVAERFVAAGFRCLIHDSRAHGQSGGTHSTYGARESTDLRAVIDTALARFGPEKLGPLLAFGVSQGAATVLLTLPDEPRLRAAVLVAPFAELKPVATRAAGNVLSLPPLITAPITCFGGWRAGFSPAAIRPIDAAARVEIPLMVVHGAKDTVIPPEDGRRIHDAAPGKEKHFISVPDGAHGNVLARGGDDLYQDMLLFWIATLGR